MRKKNPQKTIFCSWKLGKVKWTETRCNMAWDSYISSQSNLTLSHLKQMVQIVWETWRHQEIGARERNYFLCSHNLLALGLSNIRSNTIQIEIILRFVRDGEHTMRVGCKKSVLDQLLHDSSHRIKENVFVLGLTNFSRVTSEFSHWR